MTTTWFTSDHHLGHKLVSELRGFSTTAEHDEALAANWDAVVRDVDTVWVLGDLTLARPYYALRWINARPGHKRLILGNHDGIHPGHRDAPKRFREMGVNNKSTDAGWYDAFEYIASMARIRMAGVNVLLSHFPYSGAPEGTDTYGRPFDDRYEQYRLIDRGMPLLHGHTHRNEQLTRSQRGTRQVHIGLDAWGLFPVRLDQAEFLALGPGE